MLRYLIVSVLWAGSLVSAPVAAQSSRDPGPAELFFKRPAIQGAKLSPSGRGLALTASIAGGRVGLLSIDLAQPSKSIKLAHFSNVDVGEFHWVGDEQLVFNIHQDDQGSADQRFAPGLFSVKRDGTGFRELIDADVSWLREHTLAGRKVLPYNHFLLKVPAGESTNEVVVGEYVWDGQNLTQVVPKRLNVQTGIAVPIDGTQVEGATSWLFDARGMPRVAFARKGARYRLYWREPDKAEWRVLAEYDSLHAPYQPVHVDNGSNLLVLEPSGPVGDSVLKRFDLATGRPEPQALVSAPGFDLASSVLHDEVSGRLLGVHVETDAHSTAWFDPRLKALQAEADKRWPGRVTRLSCVRCLAADMTVLAYAWSDRDPGQYWVYRAETKEWQEVGASRPDVDPRRMATLDFHRIKARDGKDLPLWLTLPAGHAKGQRPPAVVLVHGGPWVRGGHWRWNELAQFLASRGYAVIEPEFRGSTGYGSSHFRAGWKKWGTAMQDDLADALLWARHQGHVSENKACIAGASYGGYAALMGPIRHPALFNCAASWVAVTDPQLIFKWSAVTDVSDVSRQYTYPQLIGDPVADAALLQEASPVARVAELKLPLLLGFGADDRRVPLEHGIRLREALRSLGRDPEWVVYTGEGHGAWTLEHELDWANRLERFFQKHLR